MRFKIGDIVRTSKEFRKNNPNVLTRDYKIIETDFPTINPIRIDREGFTGRDLFKEVDFKLVKRGN